MQYCCRRESPKGKYSLKNSKQDGKIRKLYLPNADCGVFGWEFGLGFLRRSVFATLGESSKLQTGNGSFCVAPPYMAHASDWSFNSGPHPVQCVDSFH